MTEKQKPNLYKDVKNLENMLIILTNKINNMETQINEINTNINYLKIIITDIGKKCDLVLNVNDNTEKKKTKN